MSKVSIASMEARIVKKHYWQVPSTTMTVCALILDNGYTVIGQAACVDPADFDEQIGFKMAYEDALEHMWALEGYLQRELMQ